MLTSEQVSYIEDIKKNYPELGESELFTMLKNANWDSQMIEESMALFSSHAAQEGAVFGREKIRGNLIKILLVVFCGLFSDFFESSVF